MAKKRRKRRYPKNWKQLAFACKERAGWQCEECHEEHFTPMRLSEVKKLHPDTPAIQLTPPQPIIVIFLDDEEEEAPNGSN